ncbi:MAG: DNA polymerase II large subunit [Candidatus Lokiarchaeota archaeon]|nr:DNA polymerase II large subunit [Candidatus Lokiarchaeota archaeon]
MVEMSKETEEYFSNLQKGVDECYEIAENARQKGLDPEIFVESPQAKDLAGRVEKLVGPQGVAKLIRKLKILGKSEDEIVFQVVSDILGQKIGVINSLEERVERAIRVGLAIKTMGVVSAPLEGISKILIREDQHHNKYLSLYFAGPIRAAGGTTAALCVLIADYVRKKSNIPKYEATEGEIGRYVEEVKLYDRRVHLQYPSSNDEIRFAVEHLPVEINGDSTEDEEVSAFRKLPRIKTNKIRGGACLVLNDGILLKAPKLLKIAKSMNLEGWDWLGKLKDIAQKDEKKVDLDATDKNSKVIIPPNSKYVSDVIAGRPVFSHPSEIGGHRIRYGRSRNTGLAAAGLHPVTMTLLDDFIAIGTQLRIERPGKSASICPVSSIEPPIVKLKNGTVMKIPNIKMAKECFQNIEKILFLGDILFGFGEFSENNHKLVPSGYVEEWWALELEDAIQNSNLELTKYIENPFNNIPSAKEALDIAEKYKIPLHPKYTDFWGNISGGELLNLREALVSGYNKSTNRIGLKNTKELKDILEKAFISHTIDDSNIKLDDLTNEIFISIFDLKNKKDHNLTKDNDVFTLFSMFSPIEIRNKAPFFMGTRMGRPEKSERKSMKGVQSLFPLSDKVGNTRSIEKAVELGKVKIDICRKKCPKCNAITPFNLCPKCGTHTEFQKICLKCNKYYPKNEEKCHQCGGLLNFSKEASFNIKNYTESLSNSLNVRLPSKFKGILGLTNKFKVPEPIVKGMLRAKNGLMVYKTAEIRYDATDIPLTHFKPKEINTPVRRLIELGYKKDYKNNDLTTPDQILELQVQDVLLSDDCADYFVKIANFIDDELEYFYKMDRFYQISKREDLIGHLVVGLAPHTSAGIVGRIIGFSPARSIYAHPFWHAAKRRNCDGDEDGIMLLLDPLLNFSRFYLPSKIGGRMDATLVISSVLDPNEIDSEAHNIDTLYKYPLEFYKATQKYVMPLEIEEVMNLVKKRLGTSDQYINLGFNIPTRDINEGPLTTAYKTYITMEEKINAQLHLAKIIKAVNEKNVAEKILATHFNPDILGNLRKFAVQNFRCVKCNEKFARPPLSNAGKCPKCGNKVILTVNRGGIEKYIPRAINLCKVFNLDDYTIQRMELIEEYVESLTNNPKIKQQKLSNFF